MILNVLYKPLKWESENHKKYFTPVLLDGGIKKSPIGDLNAKVSI
jgi:hypothetical protein